MNPINNAVKTIMPYDFYGSWVFDDEVTGLSREAFVAGADLMAEHLFQLVDGGKKRAFVLMFSEFPIPDAQLVIEHDGKGEGGCGDYYVHRETGLRGWLCPALLKYFERAPKIIHAKAVKISPSMTRGKNKER